jgi:hypothetical protein
MLLDLLMLTPYLTIAASLLLIATVTAVCVQFHNAPTLTGFNASRQRRAVSHRGFVKTGRACAVQEAA